MKSLPKLIFINFQEKQLYLQWSTARAQPLFRQARLLRQLSKMRSSEAHLYFQYRFHWVVSNLFLITFWLSLKNFLSFDMFRFMLSNGNKIFILWAIAEKQLPFCNGDSFYYFTKVQSATCEMKGYFPRINK